MSFCFELQMKSNTYNFVLKNIQKDIEIVQSIVQWD